ncbi:MAG: Undecaprenyl-phosphate glucose phosphotransferase [Candidatus Falkowbacteria bacterium GW2011_GWF2_43_32]|nr:MAG: Undecaprenyl-phosphate glucose phosphotransferase [Candidatus Falkowbacteria bacterium GW2011_GWF2_43_32]
MKKIEAFFSVLFVPLDFLLLILAGISAYHVRFSQWSDSIRPVIFNLPFSSYFRSVLIMAALWTFIFVIAGLYQTRSARQLAQELKKIFLACSTGLALVAIVIFFQRELFDSRFIVLAAWFFAVLYLSVAHILIRWLEHSLLAFGVGVHKVILVGNSKTTDSLIAEFSGNRKAGFRVLKRVRDFSITTAQELAEFIKDQEVDEIIQSDPNLTKAETLRLYDFANENHITFKYVADLLEVKVLRTEVTEIIGIPIVEVKRTTLEGWGRVFKRLFDIVVSGLLIIIFSPVIILTILIIKLDSPGPIFFSRRDDGAPVTRVGEGGRPFRYFKFRSMIPNSDSMRYKELSDRNLRTDGPMVKIKDDPRVTRFGRTIRRWSIDELPELFLVFIGRMSLVGPRPHLPEEVAKYENYHKKTLTIKPGITGLAQVSGRSDLLFEEEAKLDIYYIENWNMLLDLSILLRTPLAVFKHRQAE